MKNNYLRFLNIILMISLLTSCTGLTAELWGTVPTPTMDPYAVILTQLNIPPSFTPSPYVSPTSSITPLAVIPMPVTLTSSLTPTSSDTPLPSTTPTFTNTPTNTLTPTITIAATMAPPTRIPTYVVDTATIPASTSGPINTYLTQGGDTLRILAKRFGVIPAQIIAAQVLPPLDELLLPDTLLLIPKNSSQTDRTPAEHIIPDCEFVDGPTSLGFNIHDYLVSTGGYLATHDIDSGSEGKTDGAQAVQRLSKDNSLGPRLILALIEYESHWVLGKEKNGVSNDYTMNFNDYRYKGLYRQLMLATSTLSYGYYNWRSGNLTEIKFKDGKVMKLSPYLNAATAAIQYYFAQTRTYDEWVKIIDPNSFPALYESMFGPVAERAKYYEPTLTYGLTQPELSLPFQVGQVWAFTGGPHPAWEEQGALAAIDFAPSALLNGCHDNPAWVVAPADGVVVRDGPGLVILDLDGDGLEETGWNIMFLHIAANGRVPVGTVMKKNDLIGHPSCEGGVATGTHLHLARKYNGEWILADGALPFDLDGWIAHNGPALYKGTLTKNGKTVIACTCSTFDTNIIREK